MNDDASNDIAATDWSAILEEDAGLLTVLTEEWGRPFVSLSGATWWIATGGDPEGGDICADDDLERAAARLFNALQVGSLTAYGVHVDASVSEAVPCEVFIHATAFVGDNPDLVSLSPSPALSWNSLLEGNWMVGEKSDEIRDTVSVSWKRLWVKKAHLLAVFPALGDNLQAATTSPALDNELPQITLRRRGRRSTVSPGVIEAMKLDLARGYDLANATEEELKAKYGASRDVCRRARQKVEAGSAGN